MLKNCRLKRHYFKDENGKYMYGFILMAKCRTVDLYVDTIEEREAWIAALKKFVILLDLKEELKVVRPPIGEGNFARVDLCYRKTDPKTKYALKTIQKKAKQNREATIVRLLKS